MDTTLPALAKAIAFCTRAHAGQFRKDGVTPYAAHVLQVTMILRHELGCDDEATLTAACLHDVLEDTSSDYDELAEKFGARVADMVVALTKDSRLPAKERDRVYYQNLATCDWRTRLIKVADSSDNLRESLFSTRRGKAAEKGRHTLEIATGNEPAMVKGRTLLKHLIKAEEARDEC